MTHRAPQDDHWRLRLAVPGPRTRFIVAVIVCLLSVGAPVVVLGVPGRTIDEQLAGPRHSPSGLGVTGALPGDPLPGDGVPWTWVPGDGEPGDDVPGDSDDAGPSGLPIPPNLPDGPLGIPGVVLGAYQRAERTLAASRPGCHLSWSVLAGIGRIESGHASDGRVDAAGNALGPILGLPLDGSPGVAAIADTDRGVLDADTVWDRAVGPMQFIPTSWRSYSIDGNGDGLASPHNIYDATLAAGRYLCAGGGDLSNPAHLRAAVFRYNHSTTYVTIVLRWAQTYLSGVVPTPPAPGPVQAVVVGGAPPAAPPPAVVAQPAPPLPAATSPLPPPPLVTITTPPKTTSSSPSPPPPAGTTTTPPSLAVTTTTPPATPPPPATTPPPVTPPLPATATPTPPATTTSPATDSSPSPPTPSTTTTPPVEPVSGPPPSPPLAGQ